jgi:hypothetical protein
MVTFNDFLAANPWNDLVVQRALGDIDTNVLATALLNLPSDIQAIFYRNMSKRASELVVEQVGAKHSTHPSRIRAAQELLTELLQKHAKNATGEEPPGDKDVLPDISVDSPESIVSTFRNLADYVRKYGVLPLEGLESSITHPLLRKGIEFLVDGTDPLMIRSILEKYQETYLQQAKTTLNMIVEGIDSLAERNLPQLVEVKLRAYMVQDSPKR